ncbi:hypothetical protein LBMAG42_49910 [Deltaproteobacteria bacterium]|nr:hypothetical protein LBMAG42_49910 [Deltaproteobacteria bacterium]
MTTAERKFNPEAWRKIMRGDWHKSWSQIDPENAEQAEREAEEEREREAESERRREANRSSDSP